MPALRDAIEDQAIRLGLPGHVESILKERNRVEKVKAFGGETPEMLAERVAAAALESNVEFRHEGSYEVSFILPKGVHKPADIVARWEKEWEKKSGESIHSIEGRNL